MARGQTKKKKIVVWGAGGHALVVAEILRLLGEWEIIGFLDDVKKSRHGCVFCGASVLGGSDRLVGLSAAGIEHLALAVGDCQARLKMLGTVETLGFSLPNLVHPRAVVSEDALIGDGSVVAAGAIINPGASVGRGVIINTCASVDHQCEVGDGSHICPGVRLGGKVRIGRGAWIGIGTVVVDHVRVGEGAFIGAGAVVVGDIPNRVLAFGVPAKVVRQLG